MSAGILKLTMEQAATFGPYTVSFVDGAGTPVNLTGYVITGEVKKSFTSALLASFTLALLDQTVMDNVGKFTMTMDSASTAALGAAAQFNPAGVDPAFYYDITLKAPDASVQRILQGSIQLNAGITT